MGCDRSKTSVRTEQEQPSFDLGSVGPTQMSTVTTGGENANKNVPNPMFINVDPGSDLESLGVVNIKCELDPLLVHNLTNPFSLRRLNTLKRRNMGTVLKRESLEFIESVYHFR
jgi:hypothetical protein